MKYFSSFSIFRPHVSLAEHRTEGSKVSLHEIDFPVKQIGIWFECVAHVNTYCWKARIILKPFLNKCQPNYCYGESNGILACNICWRNLINIPATLLLVQKTRLVGCEQNKCLCKNITYCVKRELKRPLRYDCLIHRDEGKVGCPWQVSQS